MLTSFLQNACRYVALLYEQPALFLPPVFSAGMHGARLHFNLPMFARDYGLGYPVRILLRHVPLLLQLTNVFNAILGRRPVLQDILGRQTCSARERKDTGAGGQADDCNDQSTVQSYLSRSHRLNPWLAVWCRLIVWTPLLCKQTRTIESIHVLLHA